MHFSWLNYVLVGFNLSVNPELTTVLDIFAGRDVLSFILCKSFDHLEGEKSDDVTVRIGDL